MKNGRLSRRITWRVLAIILCFNVLIIAAILLFVLEMSLMNSSTRGQYVADAIAGKIEASMDLDSTIHETVGKVKKEFFADDDDSGDPDDEINFSIQILDGKGNRIAGSDSIDINILKHRQKRISAELDMYDLKDTPYYINTSKVSHTDWTVIVFQHREMVFFWGIVLATVILFVMGVGGIVIFIFMSRSIRRATQPLAFLSKSAGEIARGNFNTTLPTFRHNDEVAQLCDSFDTMQQSLRQYIEELKESTAAKAAMTSELNVAHSIQMSMLPKDFPAFPDRKDIDLYASLTPAKAVGGDLYDFFVHDGKLFFCIGDVSGKGVPAALVMAVTRTLFRNISEHTHKPSHIVETMNTNICQGNENCMFVTLFVGVLDLSTGLLRYCNAGHDAPYIRDTLLPCDANMPVGVTAELKYTEQETAIAPGTIVFLYTDGLTEAENASHEQFGMKRITDVVTAHNGTPQELIETMINAVHSYVGDTEQSDDLTMLAFKLNR